MCMYTYALMYTFTYVYNTYTLNDERTLQCYLKNREKDTHVYIYTFIHIFINKHVYRPT